MNIHVSNLAYPLIFQMFKYQCVQQMAALYHIAASDPTGFPLPDNYRQAYL